MGGKSRKIGGVSKALIKIIKKQKAHKARIEELRTNKAQRTIFKLDKYIERNES